MNKRLIYILMEYFLQNFFLNTALPAAAAAASNPVPCQSMPSATFPAPSPSLNSYYLASPLTNLIRLHLFKSSKVKADWKLMKKSTSESFGLSDKTGPTTASSSNGAIAAESSKINTHPSNSVAAATNESSNASRCMSKSKSFYNEINCWLLIVKPWIYIWQILIKFFDDALFSLNFFNFLKLANAVVILFSFLYSIFSEILNIFFYFLVFIFTQMKIF